MIMFRVLSVVGLAAALASLLLCSPRGSMAVDEKAANSAADWAKMQPIRPRGYVCCRAEKPPAIDGKLDDAAWTAVPWSEPFVDIEGEAKPKPKFRTRMKMLWDDRYLYVGAELEEPHVWGTLEKHDSIIFQDNDFELFVDPDGDNHQYMELELNALNTTWDLFLPKPYKDGGEADFGFEFSGMKSAVHVDGTLNDPRDTDRGWSLELAIPWSAMEKYAHRATPPREGDQWRMNFSRVEWQIDVVDGKYRKRPNLPENNWIWSPQGIIDMHRPERWGFVQFSRASPEKAKFVLDPALPARDALMEIYHLQKSFYAAHGTWAGDWKQLQLAATHWQSFAAAPQLKLTADGFEATLPATTFGEKKRLYHVSQDSRLWTTAE